MTNSTNSSVASMQYLTSMQMLGMNNLINPSQHNNGVNYFDTLQELYNEGKEKQDEPICENSATKIINNFGINFGSYTDDLTSAIKGMTRIEAFMYLNEVLSHVDKADGTQDQTINPELDLTSAFIFSGIEQSQKEIKKKLETSAAEFKNNTDPTDANNIVLLKSTQNATVPQFNPVLTLSPFRSFSLPLENPYDQMGNFTDALGVTNPSVGNALDATGVAISDMNNLLNTMLPMLNMMPLLMQSLGNQGNSFTNMPFFPPVNPFDMFSATNNFNTLNPNINNYMGYRSY